MTTDADTESLLEALRGLDLVGADETPPLTPLTGGVSSDIWRVDAAIGPFCVKRALAKLKVQADWRAPIGRNANEVGWMQVAHALVPGCVPEILGHDAQAGLFAMAWLPPEDYPLWKTELRDGHAVPAFAAAVGRALGRIHAGTAGDAEIAQRFATDPIFHAIRLEPYLLATAELHQDMADRLEELAQRTATQWKALVHGDVSPKNILIGPSGPVFLDAECAWYGDPAFDIAFCLNHLLLKCLWTPAARDEFLACFDALADAWLGEVTWEPRTDAEERAATLLPALTLARIDGKSPVEYLTKEADKSFVRRAARTLIKDALPRLASVRNRWQFELEHRRA